MKLIDNFKIGLKEFIRKEIMLTKITEEEYINEYGVEDIKLSFLTDIFGITTYDSGLDVKFGNAILEVMEVIAKRNNFEYIKDESNYIKFILVANILDKYNWIEWGTSIRGCWFSYWYEPEVKGKLDSYNMSKITFDDDNNDIIELIEYLKCDKL